MANQNTCCQTPVDRNKKSLLSGFLYGILPHTFCIGFIVFSVIGAATATAVFRKFLLVPYLFQLMVAISFVFATISAIIYLKRNNRLCLTGIKDKWKYLTILYLITALTNVLMFSVVFPALANKESNSINSQESFLASTSISVAIPCSGHAPLIIDELKKDTGVGSIKFKMPNTFEIKYNPQKTSPEKIISLAIFKTYKAIIQ